MKQGCIDEKDFRNQPSNSVNENKRSQTLNQLTLNKLFYSRKETAGILSVSLGTLNNWDKKKLLVPIKIGGVVRYDRDDIYALSQNKEGRTT